MVAEHPKADTTDAPVGPTSRIPLAWGLSALVTIVAVVAWTNQTLNALEDSQRDRVYGLRDELRDMRTELRLLRQSMDDTPSRSEILLWRQKLGRMNPTLTIPD